MTVVIPPEPLSAETISPVLSKQTREILLEAGNPGNNYRYPDFQYSGRYSTLDYAIAAMNR